jgi:hypothetical protein
LTYVAKSKKTATLANPVGLSCGKCGVINTVESKVAIANAGKTHCVCCGNELNYDVDDIDETSAEDDDIDMNVTDILEDDEDDMNLDVVSAEDEDEDEDEESEEESDDEDEDEESDEDEDEEEESEEGSDEDEDEDEDKKEESSLALASLVKGKSKFLLDEDKLYAFKGDVCVATLSGDNIDVIASTINRDVANDGLETTLANYGFKLNKVSVKQNEVAARRIQQVTASAEQKAQNTVNKFKNEFQESLTIACAGISKGLFGKDNPLKTAMVELLEANGVRNATKQVNQVFASTSNEYNATLLETAMDVNSKPASVRKEYVNLIKASEIVPDDTDEEYEDETEEESTAEITARLLNPTTPSTTPVVAKVSSSKSSTSPNYDHLFSLKR